MRRDPDGIPWREVWIAVVQIAAAIALVAAVYALTKRQNALAERAAYLEGRWAIDRETAMIYARAELGGRVTYGEVARLFAAALPVKKDN